MENGCKYCQGTGWVIKKNKGTEFAVVCKCQKPDIFLSKCEKANIPARFIAHDLRGYFPQDSNPSQIKAKKIVKKFIDDYPGVEKGLLLQGSIGLGKTRLLCSIATEFLRRVESFDVFYIDWNDLVREMRSGEDHSTRDFLAINQLINKLSKVSVLLFDELGGSKVSPWVSDNIYYLFNKRYNNKRITVCATNFYDNPSDGRESLTQRIGDRIRSRLFEMTMVVEICGDDYRQRYE